MAAALCGVNSIASSADAEDRHVVLLMPRALSAKPWPEGTQSTIAELAASNYQVLVEASAARSLDQLRMELRGKGNEADAAGALAVLRDGSIGIAYVWTGRNDEVLELRTGLEEGAIGEAAFALRIAEMLRDRALPLPNDAPRAANRPAATKINMSRSPSPSTDATTTRTPAAFFWFGGGPMFTSATTTPFVAFSGGIALPLVGRLALDATACASLPLALETRAGRVELSARHFSSHFVAQVWSSGDFSVAAGPGAGVLWMVQDGTPETGFAASSDATATGVLSARARARWESRSFNILLTAEPGLLVPPVDVRADAEQLARLGRPWVLVHLGLGWTL